MVETGMEHLSPLGRDFIDNAETFAAYAISNPVQTVGDVDFEIYAKRDFVAQAVVTLPCGTTVDGFAKSASQAGAAQQVMIGQLATLLGAPAAPYLLVRGETDLPAIDFHDDHEPGYTLFSPRVFTNYSEWVEDQYVPGSYTPYRDLRPMGSVGLGAGGQFRAWLHDKNFYALNLLQEKATGAVCLIDHEESDPTRAGIDEQSAAFIREGWRSRQGLDQQIDYLDGAKLMARRIATIRPHRLERLAEDNAEAGLPVARSFTSGLIGRRALLERPFVPVAERDRWNLGWRRPAVPKAG